MITFNKLEPENADFSNPLKFYFAATHPAIPAIKLMLAAMLGYALLLTLGHFYKYNFRHYAVLLTKNNSLHITHMLRSYFLFAPCLI